jgi:hypothetical protein
MLFQKLLGARPVAASVPTLTFGAGAFSTNDTSTYTFTSIGIGAASSNRYVVVAVGQRGVAEASATVTVAGQSCTQLAETGTGAKLHLFITDAPVTTGTTATVVVSCSSGRTRCFISTYALSGQNDLSYLEASASGTNPCNVTSAKTAQEVGVAVGHAVTTGSLSAMNISGPATSNYNSGVQELGCLLAATVTGSGTVSFSTTGNSSSARAIIAVWS